MKVKVRKVVDLDYPVNLKELSPFQKLSVGVKVAFRNSNFYKRRREKELERKYRDRVFKEESLKKVILKHIENQLVKNDTMKAEGLKCSKIILSIDRELEDVLVEIINHKDFVSENLRLLDPNPDMLKSFKDMPLMLEITRKVVGSDEV